MAATNFDQRRIAQPVQGIAGSDGQAWLYSWNTGELSVLELPAGMEFDPRAELPIVTPVDLTFG